MISRILGGARMLLLGLVFVETCDGRAAAATAAPVARFRHVTLDDRVAIGYGLALADIDGDRRIDIVLADKQVIAWYRNPDWRRFVMAERLTELDHVCVAARDIDGDGKAEVAAGAGWNPSDTIGSGALFFLKAPEDRTRLWEPVRLAHDPTIHRIRWVRTSSGSYDLVSVPLHGRGNRNASGDGVRILAYHPPRNVEAAWTTTALNESWHAAHNVEAVASDDGASPGESLRVATREGVFALMSRAGAWAWQPIASSAAGTPDFIGAGEVRSGRAADGTPLVATVEPMHGNQVVVYRPLPDRPSAVWQRTVLDASLIDGHGVVCGDFLGQGWDQVVAGWRAMNQPGKKVGLRLYAATDASWARWETQVVDDGQMACEDLQAADLDGDGDLDLVASGRATKNLKVYLNERLSP